MMSLTTEQVSSLHASATDATSVLRAALDVTRGQVAVMSSFGAESAVLLALIADIDPACPVLFLNTGQHFPETLAYRQDLARFLGLTNVQDIGPSPQALRDRDPIDQLWAFDPDACCQLRKVEPLDLASLPFPALITGRKRSQAATRHRLEVVEETGDGRVKINPLADWSAEDLRREAAHRALPPHPLASRGYPSIGCAPCTRPVAENEDARAGRWAGLAKTECGIHRPT